MTIERRHPHVVHTSEVEPYEMEKGKHHIKGRQLGRAAGNEQLGATLTEIPPGSISFPFHYHCANEEAVFVVSGTGTVRIGDAHVKVRAGDWIAHPVGPAHAHQMINDGSEPLVYLCISTALPCELVGYPDSKKFGARAGMHEKQWFRTLWRGDSLDYWDGEPNT